MLASTILPQNPKKTKGLFLSKIFILRHNQELKNEITYDAQVPKRADHIN